jgi:hypothetical protein
MAQALCHVFRAGPAVHPDEVNRKGFERGERRANLRSVEHRAEDFYGHLRDDWHAPPNLCKVIEDSRERRLRLKQVLASFDL